MFETVAVALVLFTVSSEIGDVELTFITATGSQRIVKFAVVTGGVAEEVSIE